MHMILLVDKSWKNISSEHGDDGVVVKDIIERLMTDTTRADKDAAKLRL